MQVGSCREGASYVHGGATGRIRPMDVVGELGKNDPDRRRFEMTRVLLVEDHEEIWDFLSRRLKRRGYEVILATDGQQAVD